MNHSNNLSYFPAEWHKQSAVHLVWPSENSDWKNNYKEVVDCYVSIVKAILGRQKLLIVFPVDFIVDELFTVDDQSKMNISFAFYNDTWVRDYGGLSVIIKDKSYLLDFKFNGWGNKFSWDLDNKQTKRLVEKGVFADDLNYQNQLDFVLEGGSIDSNGSGLLFTTESCLLNPNRNGQRTKKELEGLLKEKLAIKQVLWLKHGNIIGDDTDGHVDTLVRFVNESTIVYVKCSDSKDEHFESLSLMEQELKRICEEQLLTMIPLPMPQAVFDTSANNRLPATYANFLITNTAVLLPCYGCPQDSLAINILETCFPNREIISINCLGLIKQGGSLHCATMQYPEGFVK
jgi:agmatine deiminase